MHLQRRMKSVCSLNNDLKELSYEIEMGCLWYGWKEPYLEMNL